MTTNVAPVSVKRRREAGPDLEEAPPVSQVCRAAGRALVEIHLCARPPDRARSFGEQAVAMYDALRLELRAEGARPSDVVAEKVFLRDIGAHLRDLQRVRREVHLAGAGEPAALPAATFIQQPPARPGQLCEVQALALLPAGGAEVTTRAIPGLPPGASGRIVETPGAVLAFLANLTAGAPGTRMACVRQAEAVFRGADACLRREGLGFGDVVRTWIYLRDIVRDYGALNRARNRFFAEAGIAVPPASTGIQGIPHPEDRACALDLRAAAGAGVARARALHAPTMNEAPAYGSAFSRGMRVGFPDREVLYVSGTASIDAEGRVVGGGDIEAQADRMLLNVEALLAGEGASLARLTSAVTYLKRPGHRAAFLKAARRRGLPDRIPNTICVAEVCRPEWLCEMEAVAVLT
jgi:enamine deaminase RidA (YjgF/YER057c/UK114 family)